MSVAVSQEAVGPAYALSSMKMAQQVTWRVIERIAAALRPGMKESQAQAFGKELLSEMGIDHAWHPLLIRFGVNTLKTFKERSDGDPVLGEDDIFFIDMGAVWEGHEGDAGATFTTGADSEMQACASAAKTLFNHVEDYWRSSGASGQDLYRFAEKTANEMGWVLNLHIKGHRVSDFPHAIYKAGDLGDFGSRPNSGLWILEIQIAHPTRPFGAFYEDLLV
ncbi:MAG: M24 family metallopeptidase [Parvibaculaceae bacterium]|nr:M24 family metallopeptidase [Parvibaculaceae bacterium]